MDNLNYYSNWLPAWQQTDKYSSQPWCLKSKNLDIFSSSKSVKATAWSEPTTIDNDIIKQDWKLILKTDGKVYERDDGGDTLIVDPSVNFPVYQVSYTWYLGTYADAQRWTPQDMVVKYDWAEWVSFVVYTDKSSYTYNKVPYIEDKWFWDISSNLTSYADDWPYNEWYKFKKSWSTWNTASINILLKGNPHFAKVPFSVFAEQDNDSDTDISLDSVTIYEPKYYYDPQTEWFVARYGQIDTLTPTGTITNWITFEVDSRPYNSETWMQITFRFTRHEGITSWYAWNWNIYVNMNVPDRLNRVAGTEWDYNEYYSYLSVTNRKIKPVWEYYRIKGDSFQTIYSWDYERIRNKNWLSIPRYDFVAEYGWENNISMDVIWMISWNDSFYMIGNMDWNWYIIPCDLTWSRGTPFIAYGCEFKWVANIDYLLYLVWEDRGISQLWVFNQQELVSIVWGNEEKNSKNLLEKLEQYKFDWKMVEYRGDLVLSTSDNRIFGYWQTYWGKGWAFIHELPWTITDLRTDWNDLVVDYSVTTTTWWVTTTTKYTTTYQDDVPVKRYNTEWEAVYPIVIWNHLLEKEESDLYASYILPSDECKLEFWGMANHYHFWTFKTDWNTTPTAWTKRYIDWSSGYYMLDFVEANDGYLTFKLEWDLPIMTWSETMRIRDYLVPAWQPYTYISFTEINHFRKIWEITTTEYQEWEFRFTNLNNKLELPKSYSLQIMVKGKGTTSYTPELFAIDLVANQRDRW